MYKTILFDIDGTLLDSEKNLLTAFQSALRDVLHISRDRQNLEQFSGLNEKKAALLFTQVPKKKTCTKRG